jgi:hypothetical protein
MAGVEMEHTRPRGHTEAQRRRLLMDTIGRHAFGARQIERQLGKGSPERQLGRANLSVDQVASSLFEDGAGPASA